MRPKRYFYVDNIETDAIEVIFSADHLNDRADLIDFEWELRRQHADDIATGTIDIRSSEDKPLRAEVWAQLTWRRDVR
jgi:hypothetical protein